MSCDAETFQMIQKVFQLQNEREHVLKLFEEAHEIYMINGSNQLNLSKFRQLVMDSTKDLKRISLQMNDLAKRLRQNDNNNSDDKNNNNTLLPILIEKLQNFEENRLQLIVKLQMAKKDAKDNYERPQLWNKVANLKEQYNNSIQSINECIENLRTEAEKIPY